MEWDLEGIDCFSVGSGSTYAYGVLDSELKYNISINEAIELGKRAIYHATHRDAYSGGYINVYHITLKNGSEFISHTDSFDLHQQYYKSIYDTNNKNDDYN